MGIEAGWGADGRTGGWRSQPTPAHAPLALGGCDAAGAAGRAVAQGKPLSARSGRCVNGIAVARPRGCASLSSMDYGHTRRRPWRCSLRLRDQLAAAMLADAGFFQHQLATVWTPYMGFWTWSV